MAENVRAILELQTDAQGRALSGNEVEKRLSELLADLRVEHLRDSPSVASHWAWAARRTPKARRKRSVSRAPSPKASANRPAPMRRWVSSCHRRSWACATPRPNITSRTLAARIVGMPWASRRMRISPFAPGSCKVPSATGLARQAYNPAATTRASNRPDKSLNTRASQVLQASRVAVERGAAAVMTQTPR